MKHSAMMVLGALVLAGGLAHAAPVTDDLAAGAGYGSENLTFDIWCREIQKYPASRCDEQSKADQTAYNDTKLRLQAIEVQHDKEQRKEQQFRKDFDQHGDPYRPPEKNN